MTKAIISAAVVSVFLTVPALAGQEMMKPQEPMMKPVPAMKSIPMMKKSNPKVTAAKKSSGKPSKKAVRKSRRSK